VAFVPAHPVQEEWRWGPSWKVSTNDLFRVQPRSGALLLDEELYLGTLDGVRRGAGFYRTQNGMLNMNPGRWNTRSPLAYRQPLLTYVWLLVGNGAATGIIWSALAGFSMAAAYWTAARLVRPLLAVLAPFALCIPYSLLILHPPRLLYAESWAGPLLVAAGALCALNLIEAASPAADRRRSWLLSILGAGFACAALFVRELSLAVAALAAFVLLLDGTTRARWLFAPWIAGIALWAAGYAVHVGSVLAVSHDDIVRDPAQGVQVVDYFNPGLNFLAACVRWISISAPIVPLILFFCVLAVAGAFTLRKPSLGLLVGGSTAGVLALLLLTGTPGVLSDGSYTGYWGFLFMPVVLAWTPLGLRLLPGGRAAEHLPPSLHARV
jgi:hypothetical protein